METNGPQLSSHRFKKTYWKEIITPILLIIFLGAVIFGIYQLKEVLTKPPYLEVNLPENSKTTDDRITIVGETEREASLKINSQEIEINNDGGFSHELDLNVGENKIILSTEKQGTEATIIERTVTREEIVSVESIGEEETVLGADTYLEEETAAPLIVTQAEAPVVTEDLSTSGPAETGGIVGLVLISFALYFYRKSRKAIKIGQTTSYKLFTN